MDTLKEFFADLKDRVGSPIFSSFIISWIICNWPIVLALLFYSQDDVKRDGYKSFINLVHKESGDLKMIIYPLIGALSYTFLYPILKDKIKEYYSYRNARLNTRIYEKNKETTVTLEYHQKQISKALKRSEEIAKLAADEKLIVSENANLRNDVLRMETELSTITASNEAQILKSKQELQAENDRKIQEMVSAETERIDKINADYAAQISELRQSIQDKAIELSKLEQKIIDVTSQREMTELVFKNYIDKVNTVVDTQPDGHFVRGQASEGMGLTLKSYARDAMDFLGRKER